MPKVSICIPTYNNVHEVERLLSSIRQQTYTDYEVVITDDSTNAEIEELVGHFVDLKVRYVHNAESLGHIFNWNEAIRRAEGEYIKIMFSDDWFTYPESLEELVRLLEEHPEADLAFSNSMQVSEKESYERKISSGFIPRIKADWRHLFLGNEIGAPSDTIYRKNGIEFDEKSNWASDLELYLHLLSLTPRFAYTTKPLVSIGMHGEQYTHTFSEKDPRIFNDYLYMYTKYKLWENESCRGFFLKEYLVKYGKGARFAQNCKIDPRSYRRARRQYLWQDVIKSYVRAIGRKLRKDKSVK